MATFYADNHKGLYVDEPFDYMNKGEVAGRCRNMFDRYEFGINADAIGDKILIGGILPPNLTIIDAWIGTDQVLDAGVTLELLGEDTMTEAKSEADLGQVLLEGPATGLIPATLMDANSFVRMGDTLVRPNIAGFRLGHADGKVGTQLFIEIGGAPVTVGAKLFVFVMYASD